MLLVFILAALVIGILTLLVLTAAAITASIRGHRKHPAPASPPGVSIDAGVGGQEWFWRQDSFLAWAVTSLCRPTQPPGDYPPLIPDDDLHTGHGREDAAGAKDGRPREIETWTGAARPTPPTKTHPAQTQTTRTQDT